MIEQEIDIILGKIKKRKQTEYVKSPLNYTGNKYRILSQILPHMPKKIDLMVDLFAGGATVGLNVEAKNVVFVDSNIRVINLLKYLATYNNVKDLLKKLLDIIKKYNLSLSSVYGYAHYKKQIIEKNPNNGLKAFNEKGFYKLRKDYNEISDKNSQLANEMLYILMVYAFNNDMRFSKAGDFNLPAGKTDFNLNNALKLHRYIERTNIINFDFICGDFMDENVLTIIQKADFIYMDPPYLITNAVYNESDQWNNEDEHRLLNFIDKINDNKKDFMLSNVIEKKYKRNEPLYYWTQLNKDRIKVLTIDYHYRSSSYNKKNRDGKEQEVIIVPRRG